MSRIPDDDDRLTTLLRSIPAPEPPPDFLAGARSRYAQALEARDRRRVLTALLASVLGLGAAAVLVLAAFDPVALAAQAVILAAEAAAWMTGFLVVLSIVPPPLWAPALLGTVASLVLLVLLGRRLSPLPVK